MNNYNFSPIRPYMIPCRLKCIKQNSAFLEDEHLVYHSSYPKEPIGFKKDTAIKYYISGVLLVFTNKVGRQVSKFYNNDGKLVCKFYNYNPELLEIGQPAPVGKNTLTVFDNLIVCEGFVNGKNTCLGYDYLGNCYQADSKQQLIENLKSKDKYLPMYIDCQKDSEHEFSM